MFSQFNLHVFYAYLSVLVLEFLIALYESKVLLRITVLVTVTQGASAVHSALCVPSLICSRPLCVRLGYVCFVREASEAYGSE